MYVVDSILDQSWINRYIGSHGKRHSNRDCGGQIWR
jgi:hypothetical protein